MNDDRLTRDRDDDARASDASFAERLKTALADDDRDAVTLLDGELDALLPPSARALSMIYWTPLPVAVAAATFLAGERGERARILDVGSGAGKFCVSAAAATGALVVGIEQSARLVRFARELAAQLGLERARFRKGDMATMNWRASHGVYLFNPFAESFLDNGALVDASATRQAWPAYVDNVRTTLAKLYLMPIGTRVATFHGLGAELPPGYEQVDAQRFGEGMLRFYIRRNPRLLVRRFPHDFHSNPGLFDRRLDVDPAAVDAARSRASTTCAANPDPLSLLAGGEKT